MCITKQNKFVTHGLIVISDISERAEFPGAALDTVDGAFSQDVNKAVPFLLPGRLFYEFIIKKNSLFSIYNKHFKYFFLPRGGFDKIQFILCYPLHLLKDQENNLIIDEDFNQKDVPIPKNVTENEKKHGIFLEHFSEISVNPENSLEFQNILLNEKWAFEKNAEQPFDGMRHPEVKKFSGFQGISLFSSYLTKLRAAKSLQYVLNRFFVPLTQYEVNVAPRWALMFAGHGKQYQTNTNIELYAKRGLEAELKNADFLDSIGIIGSLDSNVLSETISELTEKIIISFIDLNSCFAGGINTAAFVRNAEMGVIPPFRFILGSHTVVGDAIIHSAGLRFDLFFEKLFSINFSDLAFSWEFNIPSEQKKLIYEIDEEKASSQKIEEYLKVQSEAYKNFRKQIDEDYKKISQMYDNVYASLADAYKHIIPDPQYFEGRFKANDIPVFKPVEANYFVEIAQPWLKRIGKKEIEFCGKSDLKISKDIRNILLYTNTIPCTILLEGINNSLSFVSAIPGDTFHHIEKLKNKNGPIAGDALVEMFCNIEGFQAQKLFYIGLVNNVELFDLSGKFLFKGPCELMITFNHNEVEAVFCSKTQNHPSYLFIGQWKEVENIAGISTGVFTFLKKEIISRDVVLEKIKTFNNTITWLKKLANIQASYRFLKDADIEILPWSAQDVPEIVRNPWLFEDFALALQRI